MEFLKIILLFIFFPFCFTGLFADQTLFDSFFTNPFLESIVYLPDKTIPNFDYIYSKIGRPEYRIEKTINLPGNGDNQFPFITLIYPGYYLDYLYISGKYILSHIIITNNNFKLKENISIGMSFSEIPILFGNNYEIIYPKNSHNDLTAISYSSSNFPYSMIVFYFKSDKLYKIIFSYGTF
jgi:hypothetical protein